MSKFVKAKLIAQGGGKNIEFMFNPTELSFSRSMNLNSSGGARTDDGIPKVSFGSPEPYSVTVGGLVFDTYETGENVIDKYIESFRQAVEFLDSEERPPMYLLTWGKQEYLRCFVQSLSYKLTMFLPDGTPVRATVDITLQEIGEVNSSGSTGTPSRGSRRR
ncbi:hypothetical protein IQ241_21460 [Romeria aff. gracilis LEGE 07310]|uniref:Contractile injection system tube protein N-terminal domain-containing protein n=1 Tax=Vasconcelosia minhoensis LEGE 07310 TaxID=915328 RepID=A0A8J7ASY0_9CYAN|nr:hypothetical protein [Romeria gracilis]MBE9079830.1 hypothetical protein [Romeria aff. gracilis LEGE 07310]